MSDTARAGDVVRALWDRFEARDWAGAATLLDPGLVVEWPATRERFTTAATYLSMNRAYPEPWGHIRVLEIVSQGDRAAALVAIDAPDGVFRCAGFYRMVDGRIVEATELWLSEGAEQPPPERARWSTPVRAESPG